MKYAIKHAATLRYAQHDELTYHKTRETKFSPSIPSPSTCLKSLIYLPPLVLGPICIKQTVKQSIAQFISGLLEVSLEQVCRAAQCTSSSSSSSSSSPPQEYA